MQTFLRTFVVLVTITVCGQARSKDRDLGLVNDVAEMIEAAVPKLVESPDFLKPLVNSELSFIKRVCRPTVNQMDKIVVEAKTAFDSMSDMVQGNNQPFVRVGEIRFMGPNQEQLSGNPYGRVRRDAMKYLKPILSEKQFQSYVDETKLRDDFERGAAIWVVIDLMDNKLVLTIEQRQKLYEKLLAGWRDIEISSIQNYVSNPNYMPQVPNNLVDPVLSTEQRSLWNAASQTRVQFQVSIREDNTTFLIHEDWIR